MNKKNDFQLLMDEGCGFGPIWANMINDLDSVNTLDKKTRELIYISLLAALGLTDGIPHHVLACKNEGASEAEITSAILMGLPVAGKVVTQSLGIALETYRK